MNTPGTRGEARPRLHLTAAEGWVNDPLGLTFHDGRYHLFFQYVPDQVTWAPSCHWGHATSEDLLHWEERRPALLPGDGDDGCWSGSIAVDDDGAAHLFYTSVTTPAVEIGRPRIATPRDATWDGWAKGAVVGEIPDGIDVRAYRDPYVVRDGDVWRMVVGAGLNDGTATAYVHTSPDLRTWTFQGELARRSPEDREGAWTGETWECPQVFALGGRDVLTVSVCDRSALYHEAYALGEFREGRFEARTWGRLSYGPAPYAGATFVDSRGRRGFISWLRGVADPGGAWAGALSLPRVLEVRGDLLVASPHPNLDALRGPGTALDGGSQAARTSPTCDIVWALPGGTGPGGPASLALTLPGAQGPAATLSVVDGVLSAGTIDGAWEMPVLPGEIRVVVDGPVVEVFAETGVMAFPLPAAQASADEGTGVLVGVRGSEAVVFDLT